MKLYRPVFIRDNIVPGDDIKYFTHTSYDWVSDKQLVLMNGPKYTFYSGGYDSNIGGYPYHCSCTLVGWLEQELIQ